MAEGQRQIVSGVNLDLLKEQVLGEVRIGLS